MGWVRRVQHRSGDSSWQARWRDPTGAERAKNFDRKIDAQQYLVGLQSDMLRGSYADPRLGQTKLEEWLGEWQATRTNLSPATRLRDEASIRNHVIPALGTAPIGHLRPMHVAQWVAALDAQGLAPATARKAYQLLAASLSAAIDNGVIAITPCRKVKLPKLVQPDMRILESDEIGELAAAIDPRYQAMVLTAAYTGLRFGELAALRIERFDALRRSIRVVESLSEVRGSFHFKPPKSDAGRRMVSVPAFLVEVLAEHLARHADGSGLMFTAPTGGPIRRTNFRRRAWQPAVQNSVGHPCTFHDLRHTHAALLIAQGEHPKVIQARLGHASIKTTLDTYGHLMDGLDEAAADRLDAGWREAAGSMWRAPSSGSGVRRTLREGDVVDLDDRFSRPSSLQRVNDLRGGRAWVCLDLEIPEPYNVPSQVDEPTVRFSVPSDVAIDLLIPIVPTPAAPILGRVPVPESPIDEHGQLPSAEYQIRLAGHVCAMTPPSSKPQRIQRPA